MRTDVRIYPHCSLRLPQIPLHSPGRNSSAGRGDVVWWQVGEAANALTQFGRVICVIEERDDSAKTYLCVAMLLGGDMCCERWVDPAQVFDCRTVRNHEMLQWLCGMDFLLTPIDKARQCFDLNVTALKESPDPQLLPKERTC